MIRRYGNLQVSFHVQILHLVKVSFPDLASIFWHCNTMSQLVTDQIFVSARLMTMCSREYWSMFVSAIFATCSERMKCTAAEQGLCKQSIEVARQTTRATICWQCAMRDTDLQSADSLPLMQRSRAHSFALTHCYH